MTSLPPSVGPAQENADGVAKPAAVAKRKYYSEYATFSRVFALFDGRPPETHAEKRRAVIHVLEGLGHWRQPDGWIACQCCVSRSFVAAVRKELERDQRVAKEVVALEGAWAAASDAARWRFSKTVHAWGNQMALAAERELRELIGATAGVPASRSNHRPRVMIDSTGAIVDVEG